MLSLIAPLLFIIIFPLNLWGVAFEKDKILSDYFPQNLKSTGEIMGAEKSNSNRTKEEKPLPQFIPVRKDTATNLAIPNAHASVILDIDSGTLLLNSHENERRQIASLTKLMTAVLVLEKVKNLDSEVTVDEEAVYIDGTKIGCPRSGYCISPRLKVGEKITVKNLLTAMLMNSANDAAVALSKYVSGTQDNFVALMNEKVKAMNLADTHFCTASGLEPDGRESECYSSAYDIAQIAAYAMKYDLIWNILRQPTDTKITSVDGECSHDILNTDLVLNEIPNCIGGKTGFTPLAGNSLLLAASDSTKEHKVIAVLLDDIYRWQDIRTMIDWTFKSFEWK